MRVLVVFETLWGNTERVARVIAAELDSTMDVTVADSDSAPSSVDGFDLLVVGGPTHAFSMTRAATRAQPTAPHVPTRGIREWLETVERPAQAIAAVAFDTRVNTPRLPGSAAKAIRHELRSLGFGTRIKAKSFRVHGNEGPLVDREPDRAAAWIRDVVTNQLWNPTP